MNQIEMDWILTNGICETQTVTEALSIINRCLGDEDWKEQHEVLREIMKICIGRAIDLQNKKESQLKLSSIETS